MPLTPKNAADMGCMIYINEGDEQASENDQQLFKNHGFHAKKLVNGKYCYFTFEAHKAYEIARQFGIKVKEQPVMFVWNLTAQDIKDVDLTWAERHWTDKRQVDADKRYPYKK